MKIAKKVLSVLLAIALVLGTFAVAASANGNPDTASHQIKYWLTASPIPQAVNGPPTPSTQTLLGLIHRQVIWKLNPARRS